MKYKYLLKAGMIGRKEMPFSEVCMHLEVAGKTMFFQVTESGGGVQLLEEKDNKLQYFSFPISTTEAGVFKSEEFEDKDGNPLFEFKTDIGPDRMNYRVYGGGLMRCCVMSLNATQLHKTPDHNQTMNCHFCDNQMIWNNPDMGWRWNDES